MKHKILQKLDKYLDSATSEQLEKDCKELEEFNHSGPDMLEILGHKFDQMLKFDETIDVNSREELVEKANKYIEENFKV